jgi:hypothetical protein
MLYIEHGDSLFFFFEKLVRVYSIWRYIREDDSFCCNYLKFHHIPNLIQEARQGHY